MAILLATAACGSRPAREHERGRQPEPAGRDTLAAERRQRDRNVLDADIARGPVPGYAGVVIESGCTFVVLLTDTLAQKAAAETHFRAEVESRRPDGRANCGGPYRLGFRQVRYDFAQLYDWYVGPFRAVWSEPGAVSTDVNEGRNQLSVGVEDSAAYERMLRLVDTLAIPKGVVHVDVTGKIRIGTGGPSVMVEARDALGRPAAVAAARRPASPTAAQAATWEDLPPPSWRIVARREGAVLLAAQRVIVRGIARRDDRGRGPGAEPAREYPTLVFERGRLREGPVARAEPYVLASGAARDTLRLYALELDGRQVLFAQAGEAPQPNESPAEPGLYVLEHGDRLWLLGDSGATRLTADTVRGIARDTLRSQTAEAGPYLFWATHPLWSPDGTAIAYVTNRTWMLGRDGGQEIWLADVRPRRERPLLSEPGEYFLPVGWLGAEVVYRAREGGISAVDIRTGRRRAVAPGSVEAFAPRRARMLYSTSAGDTVRAHVLTERGVVDIPDPPPGERLDHGGVFSPSGDRVALGASIARDSGITRALYVFDLGERRLTPLARWSFREGSRHPQGLPAWLDDSTLLLTRLDRETGLESSTLVRLPPPR